MAITQAVLFEKRDYTCAVDIRKSVEALGGVEAVYRDKAKERALAKLLQSDGNEVHKELEEFIRNAEVSKRCVCVCVLCKWRRWTTAATLYRLAARMRCVLLRIRLMC